MKHSILHQSAALLVGAAFALTAVSARAEEPKKDSETTTATHHHKHVASKAKSTESRAQLEKKNAQAPIPTRDGRNSTYSPGAGVGGSNGAERSVLTGSHIPRTYHRRGYTTDSQDDHFIYDKNDIRLQSTNSVGQSLRSVPGIRVRGNP